MMTELDHLQADLSGMHLIEASAGTGKTYAIALLYLRILVEQDLRPEQVLVVTYTEAATKELRSRIRIRIREALQVLDGAATEDPLLVGLCGNKNGKWGDKQRARDILDRALKSFDMASIFTIHGFCLRALQEHAFESGSRYDTELVTNQTHLMQEIVDDFWRIRFFGDGAPLLEVVLGKRQSVDSLRLFAQGLVGNPNLKILPDYSPEQVTALDADCALAFVDIQKAWQHKRVEVVELISTAKGLSRSVEQYKPDLLPDLFGQMDSFVAGSNPFALPHDFSKLCSSGIAKGTTPKGIAPVHTLFVLCERLLQKVQERLLALQGELLAYCKEQLPLRKQQKNIRFFDDLLNNLYQALCGDNGTAYATKLRAKYRAALIDEFQDTDPVQYHIFRKIYADTSLPLFLIGDPKQAIYSFRGADIFAYMQSARDVPEDSRSTLTSNWRSTPDLLAAFNTLFLNEKAPFVYQQIQYHPVMSGRGSGKKLVDSGPEAALQICLMPSDDLNITKANKLVPRNVAAEISRLLHEGAAGTALIGDQPVLPGDIAVIVKSHRQAGSIQDALTQLGIPCVLRSTMTIFETDEASEVAVLLRALQNPGNEPALRAALVTDLLGRSGSDIAALFEDEPGWEQCLLRFRDYHQLWHEKGFMVMARLFMDKEEVRGRVLRYQDGERRLTNLLHCFEMIHGKAHERGIGIDGLVNWFSEQVSAREKSEEHEIRLETDEKAVKIVTVHVSKGLEYPVVFCPFLWGGISEGNGVASFHEDDIMVKDYGSPDFAAHKQKADKEQLAESLRLLYVDITRAKYRCYLYTGKLKSKTSGSSSIVYLLHATAATRAAENLVAALDKEYLELSAETMQGQLEELAADSPDTIAVTHLPADPVPPPWQLTHQDCPFSHRIFHGTIKNDWRVSSFSSFSSHDTKAPELPDRDELVSGSRAVQPQSDDTPDGLSIFTFPRGAQAGIFMHAIFEKLDFSNASPLAITQATQGWLDHYGFDQAWLSSVAGMVSNVISTPFSAGDSSFRLSDLRKGSWLAELEFFFPLGFISSDLLRRSLAEQAAGYQAVNLEAVLASLQFRQTRGTVRGFMDMVFEYGGRYYLLDWKSNHLGGRVEDYNQEALRREMEKNVYPLQYLLYTVALNRYLALRIRDYDYNQHFGGVLYLFIRGMSPQQGERFGVFRDLPPLGLVQSLTKCLMESGGYCMNYELRPIDRHFATYICRESGDTNADLWLAAALVSHATGQGHICLNLDDVAGTELVIDGRTVAVPPKERLVTVVQDMPAVTAPGGFCPLVLDAAGRLYLHRYWNYEQDLAQIILSRATCVEPVCEQTLQEGVGRLFPGSDRSELDWQAVAAIAAVRKRFCIISGGPGTGKTSTVVKILALLLEQHPDRPLRIALAAPTGKAAARLHESITRMKENLVCSQAVKQQIPTAVSTIHRLLGYISGSVRFRHAAGNPLPYDLVVIDEASMVDLPLMAKLAKALSPEARLILLGDRDQLASVEAGAVLGDLCGGGRPELFSAPFCDLVKCLTKSVIPDSLHSEAPTPLSDSLVVLKKNYRFHASSRIGMLAGYVNAGNGPQSLALLTDQSAAGVAWHDLPRPDSLKRALAKDVVEGYRRYLAASTAEDALALLDSFRVLCALREGIYGVAGITALIEEILAGHGLIDPRNRWYQGRPVLITANDYGMKLFNGDVGVVFPDAEGLPQVFFPESGGGARKVAPVRLPDHQTVYAMTIHKSQGSEFERVLMLLPDHDGAVLTRELIYTGITRAKQDVQVWGQKEIFLNACSRTINRKSGLMDALWNT